MLTFIEKQPDAVIKMTGISVFKAESFAKNTGEEKHVT